MNKHDWVEGLLFAGFRLLGTGLILAGVLGLVFRFIDSWYQFDPSYLAAYFLGALLRPGLVLLTGILVYLFAPAMARCAVRPVSDPPSGKE